MNELTKEEKENAIIWNALMEARHSRSKPLLDIFKELEEELKNESDKNL